MSDKTKRALEYFKKTLGEDSEEYKLLKKVLLKKKMMKINKSKEKKSIDVYYNDTCPEYMSIEISVYKLRSEGIEYKD